jgi:hypothetical protein
VSTIICAAPNPSNFKALQNKPLEICLGVIRLTIAASFGRRPRN